MFQQVIVAGFLGNDPEVRVTNSGAKVANFSVATTEKWKDKNSGELKEHTEWFRCTAFGQLAEFVEKYLAKGKPVLVTGRQRTDKVEEDGGTKYFVKLIASEVRFLPDGKQRGDSPGSYVPQNTPEEQRAAAKQSGRASAQQKPETSDFDDEIPF